MTKKFPLTNWSEKKAFTIKLGAVKKYHIAVFADPNCPWCKRFFEENTDKTQRFGDLCLLSAGSW